MLNKNELANLRYELAYLNKAVSRLWTLLSKATVTKAKNIVREGDCCSWKVYDSSNKPKNSDGNFVTFDRAKLEEKNGIEKPDDYELVVATGTITLYDAENNAVMTKKEPMGILRKKPTGGDECKVGDCLLNDTSNYIALPDPPFGGGG